MILQNEAGKLTTDFNIFSEEALNIYKYLNKEYFENFSTLVCFKSVLDKIFKAHQQFPRIEYKNAPQVKFVHNNKVLVACSGGLDSVFQALYLRDQGYDVSLFHLKNINYYTNGQEAKVVEDFAKHFGFKLYTANFSPNFKSDYKKHWQENSFKTTFINTIMLDYAISLGIGNIASGDDLRLSMCDTVLGVNTGDCCEITKAFINNFNIIFISIPTNYNKSKRLSYLAKHNALDYYNSCVGPGRLIQTQHNRYEKKFNVKLDKWNCASCRKCCMHILLDKYFNGKDIPQELEDRCWNILGGKKSADNVFFDKPLPIETRVNNLILY